MSSFSKEASRAESDPFRANISIGGGFSAYLQKPVIYPDIHLNIGCDKVRGDVRVMIVPTTDAAGGGRLVRTCSASFYFQIFHLFE